MQVRNPRSFGIAVLILCLSLLLWPGAAGAATGRVLIAVASNLSTVSLAQYTEDLSREGYTVTTATIGATMSAQDLRALLQARYAEPEGLVGCVMIGAMPLAYFKEGAYAAAPTDLYFTDLDGSWVDSDPSDGNFDQHTAGSGDKQPEIWLGRIPSNYQWQYLGFTSEANCVTNCLNRDHQYRTGETGSPFTMDGLGALAYGSPLGGTVFCDEPYMFSFFGYPPDNLTAVCSGMSTEDYLNRLTEMDGYDHYAYEHIALFGDSFYATADEVKAAGPGARFYSLNGAADYMTSGNLATTYAMASSGGLTALAAPGDWHYLMYFFAPFRQGSSWGESVESYWDSFTIPYSSPHNYYPTTLIGDPTLRRSDYQCRAPKWADTTFPDGYNVKALAMNWEDGFNFTVGDTASGDILVRKLNKQGAFQWDYVYDNANHYADYARAAIWPDGGVVVVGATQNPTAGLNWRVFRLGSEGGLIWQQSYAGPAGKDDRAEDVIYFLDFPYLPYPDVYVAGWSTNANDTVDLVLQKYSLDSRTPLWTRRLTGHPVETTVAKPTLIRTNWSTGSNDGLVLGGTSIGQQGTDFILAKYDINGNLVRTVTFDGGGAEELYELLPGFDVGYYAVGRSTTAQGHGTYIVKYDRDLNQVWNVYIDGLDVTCSSIYAACCSQETIFLAGQAADGRCRVAKYDCSGNEVWSADYGDTGMTLTPTVVMFEYPQVLVAGQQTDGVKTEAFALRYSGDGVLQWRATCGDVSGFKAGGLYLDYNYHSESNFYLTGDRGSSVATMMFLPLE